VFVLVLISAAAAARAEDPPVEPGSSKPPVEEIQTPKPPADPGAAPKADPAPKADAKPTPVAGWDDMFYLRSADKRFSLRFTGQLQADYRDYLDSGDTQDIDQFLVRRARFGLESVLFKNYEFRFLTEFGQGQIRLVDGYLNVHYWDAVQWEFGKFKQPFSYEQLAQDRFTPFMERSMIDQLVPARDVGAMIHGQNLFNGILDYGLSASNGEQNGDSDTNGAKDITGRVAVRPFAWQKGGFLERLQLACSINAGNQSEAINPSTLRTPASVPFFQFNRTVMADGQRLRWSPEVVYFQGPFGFASQYFRMNQFMRPTSTGAASAIQVNVPFEGYYIQATYLLTGEERISYSQAIDPKRPFDPHLNCFGPGAWEVVARVSRLRVGDIVFAPGPGRLADPAAVSNSATEMTLGFNWYLNKWVRAQFNYEHAWFGREVRLGPGPNGLFHDLDSFQTRLQFIF
jgi:phosphate-selective porin OprO/OprP